MAIHKAQPTPPPEGVSEAVKERLAYICGVCGEDIKKVPGGQGSTYIHAATGTVVGDGAPPDEPS